LLKSKGVIKGDDTGGGSPLWMSPEALLEEPTTVKTDVYSFGLVFWEILTQKDLFPEYNDIDIFTQDIAVKGVRPSLDGVHPVLIEIIKKCWHKDPNTRPHFKELIDILRKARVDISLPSPDKQNPSRWEDATANELWKSKHVESTKVNFETFMKELFGKCNKVENELHKNLVAALFWPTTASKERANLNMTMGKLSKLIKWFGIISGEQGNTILDRLELVMKQKWFFGPCSSETAENLLKNKAPGTFLIRLNTGGGEPIENAPFTISAVDSKKENQFLHIRCYPSKKGGFYIKVDGKQTRADGLITDLVLHLKREKYICGGDCEHWPYEKIFANKPDRGPAYKVNNTNESEED